MDTYLDVLAARIRTELGQAAGSDQEQARLHRLYAVLVLARGEQVTAADVHNAWAAWRLETQPSHPDLVPFDRLSQAAQLADEPFVLALRRVARGC